MIKQCRFSYSVKFFEKGFKDRWNLIDYTNPNEPCIFIGVYNSNDIEIIKRNSSNKIVFILGADIPNMTKLKGLPNTKFASDKQNIIDLFKLNGMPVIDKVIPLKSFEAFKPFTKGDKIYCYINNHQEGNKVKHKIELLQPAIEHFGLDKFTFGTHGHTQDEVINWYQNSFVNIQLNEYAGFTSALEMAFMGRKSISNNPAPFCLEYKSPNHIIQLIEQEMLNKELDLSVNNYLYTSDEWKITR